MSRKKTPKTISSAIQDYLDDKLTWEGLIQERDVDEAFERLWRERLAEQRELMTTDELLAAQDRIEAALPDELKKLSAKVSDAEGDRWFARERAAFEIGMEVGRRLGSARLAI